MNKHNTFVALADCSNASPEISAEDECKQQILSLIYSYFLKCVVVVLVSFPSASIFEDVEIRIETSTCKKLVKPRCVIGYFILSDWK